MDKRGWMILQVFMNRYNPKAGDALLKFLPQNDRKELLAQDMRASDLKPIFQHPLQLLERIHYSWIKPLLEKFPDRLQPLIISALTNEQATKLGLSSHIPLSPPMRTFFINQLYHLLKGEEHLPLEYLPETELSPLGKWNKQQLVNLIDFLGLYDLASEVRHIVNRDYLQNIYSCLSPKQFHYLKVCLHQKQQLVSPKLGIDPTKQDCNRLKQVLHLRGLARLGKALCGQHPDLMWYLAHTLDIGRGVILLKEYQTDAIPKITSILKQQVLNLMNFLKSE